MSRVSSTLACPMCQGSILAPPPGTSWVVCTTCGKELAITPNRSRLDPDFSLPPEADEVTFLEAKDRPPPAPVPASTRAEPAANDATRVVVAIDFGTARSGYAYAFLHDRRIIKRTAWPDQPFQYAKTSTNLLCDPANNIVAWGFSARKEMARLRRENKHAGYTHLTGFKVALRKGQPSANGPIVRAGSRSFEVVKLVADYLRHLKEFAMQELQGGKSGLLNESEVRWCLTIPAIWTDAEKHWMRLAAEEAGLVKPGADSSRLRIVLEPEAAALHCLEQELDSDPNLSQLKPGTRFMIVDAGGGTVDITVHEVEKDGASLMEVIPGAGSMNGAMEIDGAFRRVLENRFGVKVVERFRGEEPYAFVKLLDEWEQAKCNYRSGMAAVTFIPLGAELYRLLSNRYPAVLDELRKAQNGDEFNLHLDQKTMQGIFDPTLAGVVGTVKRQFEKLKPNTCDYLFLVGGFANSVLLQERIKQEFQDRVMKIIIPADPGAAVLAGAVSYGIDPSRIRARRARLTYGCRILAPFEEGVDPEPKKRQPSGQTALYCRDRFKPFVRAGDAVAVNQEVLHVFQPSRPDQTAWTVVFYASRKKAPRYTDEADVFEIGKLVVKMPDTNQGTKRKIHLAMRFGQAEIEVRAKDVASGKEAEANLQFSTTYLPEQIGETDGSTI